MTIYKSNKGKGYFILNYKFVEPIYFQYLEDLDLTLNALETSYVIKATKITQDDFMEYIDEIVDNLKYYTLIIYTDIPEDELTTLKEWLHEFEARTGVQVYLACSEKRLV